MDNLEKYKDIRSVASASALLGVVISFAYFQNKISKIETDLNEVQKHLATIIPSVDPKSKQQLEQVVKAIQLLDSRVASAQRDIKAISVEPSDYGELSRGYTRLTKSSKNPQEKKYHRTTVKNNTKKREDNYDLDDDVAAMMD